MTGLILIIISVLHPFDEFSKNTDYTISEVSVIWDAAPHNAFTDLIYFNDRWFSVFREAEDHFSRDGVIRVISSEDGDDWHSVAVLSWENGGDLRDPKFSITADGKLMINAANALDQDVYEFSRVSATWISEDGVEWDGPYTDLGWGTWRWEVSWRDEYGYSIGYTNKDRKGTLYKTSNGIDWEIIKRQFFPTTKDIPSEASIAFDDNGIAYCLLRRRSTAYLGVSKDEELQNWKWQELDKRIGGPKLLITDYARLLAVVRLYENSVRTSLVEIDRETGKITEMLTLPSGGDTGYAGIVKHDGEFWISYHSSHSGKSSIYLARVTQE